jgi:hypothetical protein
MKIIDIDFKEDGKKYFCKDMNEVFEVEEGNLIAATRNFSMAELLEMEFEEIKEAKNPYTRVNDRERYYSIFGFRTHSDTDNNFEFDNELFSAANYFNNKEYAEYIAFKETLMRRMDRFAWENNETVINWNDSCSEKYYIKFSNKHNELIIVWSCSYQSNNVYFTSREVAEKAIEEFKEDLMKLYTWEFDV